jgi:parallel beta-helix repeat protein
MNVRSPKSLLCLIALAALILPSPASAQSILSVSTNSLSFQASIGANPASKTVQVTNTGKGALKWSVPAPGVNWLTVSPTSGTNSGTLTVSVRTSAFAAGTYTTSFRVNSSTGAYSTVTVNVTVGSTTSTTAPSTTTGPDFGAIIRGVRPRGYGVVLYAPTPAASGGITHVVSTAGNDNNPGTFSQPFRTINKAAQVAVAGDVVVIRNGTYQESVYVKNSGASGKPIVFEAENRGGVVLTGGRYTFQPAAWTGGKVSSGGQFYITLKGLIFRSYGNPTSTEHAPAAVRAGLGWRIQDCLFDRAGLNGLMILDDNVTVINTTIQYSYVHAVVAFGRGGGATSPTDSRYVGVSGLRLTDVVLRGNYTSPQSLDGRTSSSVIKIIGSKDTVVDNMESYQNNGPGLWFDADNFNYVVRNSYFHDNYSNPGISPGRGVHLELSWGPALVENNVIANNAAEGIAVSNSWGVEIRNNLLVGNRECVRLSDWVSRSGSVGQYALRSVSIHRNQFRDWTLNSCMNGYGDRPGGLTSSAGISYSRLTIDYNTYEPVRNPNLSGWWSDRGFLTTITQARAINTEMNGRIGAVRWPY